MSAQQLMLFKDICCIFLEIFYSCAMSKINFHKVGINIFNNFSTKCINKLNSNPIQPEGFVGQSDCSLHLINKKVNNLPGDNFHMI